MASKSTVLRRPHTKSRNGCAQCKRRKVKCDEQAPRCRNCRVRFEKCSFESHWPDHKQQDTTSVNQNEAVVLMNPNGTQFSPLQLDGMLSPYSNSLNWSASVTRQDLELMHHYATTVFLSLADYEVYQPVWQRAVPQEAQSYRFLMHAVLAISALHMCHLHKDSSTSPTSPDDPRPYRQLALSHCNAALSDFRSTVKTTTPSNVNAIFAFSHLMVFFAFGSAGLTPHSKPESTGDAIDGLLGIFNLLRHSMRVIREAWDLVQDGALGVLLQRGPAITDRKYLSPDTSSALQRVENLCSSSSPSSPSSSTSPTTLKTLRSVLHQLSDSFVMASTKRADWGMALRFPMIFPDNMLGYLRTREPLALVILAHYCVILYRAPVRWWTAGWSGEVLRAVAEGLDERWKGEVRWPLRETGVVVVE
ncbi:hypothetical protein AJ80_08566 [Polytolypa hystricis UAMH7299]|uniref:Zn(2)-C6 fungal-type domain-containing protein n=1 Tax=Polytolypa hystricis (strain UAMH7299) TaxID=1447883 RepID=A0A2B7WXK9_POLH7|nr:hypothetical protein AJ80_08566 [Polytolypa hystricis UAMH7299]